MQAQKDGIPNALIHFGNNEVIQNISVMEDIQMKRIWEATLPRMTPVLTPTTVKHHQMYI